MPNIKDLSAIEIVDYEGDDFDELRLVSLKPEYEIMGGSRDDWQDSADDMWESLDDDDYYGDDPLVSKRDLIEIMGAEYPTGFSNVFTPSTVLAEMNGMLSDMDIMNVDIRNSKASNIFKANWRKFYNSYKQFYANNRGWFSRTLNKTYAITMEYQQKLYRWAQKYQAEVGKSSFPLPQPTPARNIGFPWNKAIILGGVVLGALVLARF